MLITEVELTARRNKLCQMRSKTVDRLLKTMPEYIKTKVDTQVENYLKMKKEEMFENDILIAEFLGWVYDSEKSKKYGYPIFVDAMAIMFKPEYYKDWKLLMKAVDHIESIGRYSVEILATRTGGLQYYCEIDYWPDASLTARNYVQGETHETRIKAVYSAVVEFIKLYNKEQ